jgi:hypothetical protein
MVYGGTGGGPDSPKTEGYWNSNMSGTAASPISGTSQLVYLGKTIYGSGTGTLSGTHGSGTWQFTDSGSNYSDTSLTYVSRIENSANSRIKTVTNNDNGDFEGYLGGTGSLWTATSGSPISLIVLGNYTRTTSGNNLWGKEIYSKNYTAVLDTTYDNGAYKGFLGGTDISGTLDGRLIALYIKGTEAGYLTSNNLSGKVYSDLNKFKMTGDIYHTAVSTTSGSTLPSAAVLSSSIYDGTGRVEIHGKIGSDGSITGPLVTNSTILNSFSIKNTSATPENCQYWGIYKFNSYGTFSNPTTASTSWTATAGGQAYFGGFFNSYSTGIRDDNTQWLARLTNGVWNNNQLTADLNGKFMSTYTYGTMTGKVIGIQDPTTYKWNAFGLGTWIKSPLTFVSNIGTTELKNNDGSGSPYLGSLDGYFGSTDSLWNSTSITAHLMGTYSTNSGNSADKRHWELTLKSRDHIRNKDITYNDGTYYGYIGGTTSLPNVQGVLAGLYVAPNKSAGVFLGTIGASGDFPYIGMQSWEAQGTITPTVFNSNININPTTLADGWYDSSTYVTGTNVDMARFTTSTGWLKNAANTTVEDIGKIKDWVDLIRFTDDSSFGVWKMRSLGSYTLANGSNKWMVQGDFIYQDSSNLNSYLGRMKTFGSNMSTNDNGYAQGAFGDLATGKTRLMVGNTIKTTDSSGNFGAISAGPWLETSKFLSMISSDPSSLNSLGYPTKALQTRLGPPYGNISVQLTGSGLNSTSVIIGDTSPIKFYTYTDSSIDPGTGPTPKLPDHLVWATNSITGSWSSTGSINDYYNSNSQTGITISGYVSGSVLAGKFKMQDPTSRTPGAGTGNWLAEITFSGYIGDYSLAGGYLPKSFYGVGAGTYNDTGASGTITGTAVGLNKTLDFMNSIGLDTPNYANLSYYDQQTGSWLNDGRLIGVMGSESSLWAATAQAPTLISLTGLYVDGPADGKLSASTQIFSTEINAKNGLDNRAMTPDGGSYWGILSGVNQVNGPAGSKGSLNGLITGLYIDPSNNAGIMRGRFDGVLDTVGQGWAAQGTIMTSMMSATTIAPGDLQNNIVRENLSSGTTQVNFDQATSVTNARFTAVMANLNDPQNRDWGVWNAGLSSNVNLNGADSTNPSNLNGSWQYVEKDTSNMITKIVAAQTINNSISNGVVQGTAVGYYGDGTSGTTGILVGDSRMASEPGRFNPWKTTLQMAQAGVWLDSNKLASNLATDEGKKRLKDLNVPVAEIGRATMTGTWSAGTNSMNVTMKDMVFLAPNSGDRPAIWSTGNVSGSYAGNPTGAAVPLSGGGANLAGMTANFNVQQWNTNTNKWLSTVTNGSGKVINLGNAPNVQNNVPITFQGAAAGAINKTNATFSGTAAGTVK